jgi:ClpP class serine protease
VYDAPLAIIPAKLEAILHAIGPRLTVDQAALDSLLSDGTLSRYSNLVAFDGEGLAAFDGDDEGMATGSSKQTQRPYALTDSGVAIIPVKGTLLKSGSWISAASGCSSYSGIRNAFDAALDDAKVRAICFDVDSPGGTTHGCFELADYIRSRRGEKPSCACANDLAASAAYAIASAADSVWVTSTGAVGSVGVFALHASQEKLDDKMGVRYTYIFHGGHKTDGNPHEALSDAAYADMKAEVDREGEIFEACVAANRNVAAEKIVALQARVKFGAKSLPLLADEVGTLAETIAYLESVADKVDGVDGKAGRATISSEMPAIPPHKTSTSAKSWNGPLAKKRLREGETAEYYRKAYAFQKADTDGHNKSNFTYIHHEVGSDGHVGAANLKACQSSIGVLNGGRAGTVLKGADRKGVYNHVAAHLRDAGKEPSPLASYLSYLDGARAYALETHDLALMTSVGDLLASTDFDVVDVDIDSDTTATTAEIAGGVNDMAAKTGTGVEKKGPKGEDYMKESKSKGGKADEMCEGADEKEDDKSAASKDENADEHTDDEEKNQERKKSKKAAALAKAKLAAAKAELELLAAAKDDDDEDGEEDEDED